MFVIDLQQVIGFLPVLRFPQPIKLTATIQLKYSLYHPLQFTNLTSCYQIQYLNIQKSCSLSVNFSRDIWPTSPYRQNMAWSKRRYYNECVLRVRLWHFGVPRLLKLWGPLRWSHPLTRLHPSWIFLSDILYFSDRFKHISLYHSKDSIFTWTVTLFCFTARFYWLLCVKWCSYHR